MSHSPSLLPYSLAFRNLHLFVLTFSHFTKQCASIVNSRYVQICQLYVAQNKLSSKLNPGLVTIIYSLAIAPQCLLCILWLYALVVMLYSMVIVGQSALYKNCADTKSHMNSGQRVCVQQSSFCEVYQYESFCKCQCTL